MPSPTSTLSIWHFALGYFLCYVPYSALTKALSGGLLSEDGVGMSGFAILPLTTLASAVGMIAFISLRGWWRYSNHVAAGPLRIPVPGRWTLLSGICTAGIIATTTLAYTIDGASIITMMLLMRGGVLILAPVVDAMSRRRVRWTSWVALGLSLAAVLVATAPSPGSRLALPLLAVVDVTIYLLAYLIRLRFMSKLAKSDDRIASIRYFVEEQLVASPVLVVVLALAAVLGEGAHFAELRSGFVQLFDSGHTLVLLTIGLLSQGTGIFGALVLLDGRENTFCVPVNRASSVLAGIVASAFLAFLPGAKAIPGRELAGAAIVILAIVVLSAPELLAARRKKVELGTAG